MTWPPFQIAQVWWRLPLSLARPLPQQSFLRRALQSRRDSHPLAWTFFPVRSSSEQILTRYRRTAHCL